MIFVLFGGKKIIFQKVSPGTSTLRKFKEFEETELRIFIRKPQSAFYEKVPAA